MSSSSLTVRPLRSAACCSDFSIRRRATVYFTFALKRVSCETASLQSIAPSACAHANPTFCETAPSKGILRRQAIPKSAMASAASRSSRCPRHQMIPFWHAESSMGDLASDGWPGVGPSASHRSIAGKTSDSPKTVISSRALFFHFAPGTVCSRSRQCSSNPSQPARAISSFVWISSNTICDHGPRPGSSCLSPSTRISSPMTSLNS